MTRITNNMITFRLLTDLQNNISKLSKYQHQLATGKKFDRPSDNPVGAVRELQLGTSLTENKQYNSNLDDAVSWLSFTDSALDQIQNVVHRIRELTVYAGDAALNKTDLEALAKEVLNLRDELIQVSNTQMEGKYLFAGLDVTTRPFEKDENGNVIYKGNTYDIEYEIEPQEMAKINIHGRELFKQDYTRYYITGKWVTQDFRWKGRNEILLFKVGDRIAKIRIPEQWNDTDNDNIHEWNDDNMYRDPGEVKSYTLRDIVDIINSQLSMGDVEKLVSVELQTDPKTHLQRIVVKSRSDTPVQIIGFMDPELKSNLKGAWLNSNWTAASADTLTIDVNGTSYNININAGDTLEDIKNKINNALTTTGVFATIKEDQQTSQFRLELQSPSDTVISITSAGGIDQTLGIDVQNFRSKRSDISHVDLAEFLGISTNVKSREFSLNRTFDFSVTPLHLKLRAADHEAAIYLNSSNATLNDIADAINQAAGDWLYAVVEKDGGDPTYLGNSEPATQRLILYTKDGTPLTVYDYLDGGNWSQTLGINTALQSNLMPPTWQTQSEANPLANCYLPEQVIVRLGDERYIVQIKHNSTLDDVGKTIVNSIGSDKIGYELQTDASGQQRLVLFAKNGAPLTITDTNFSDPVYKDYSGNVALQLGISSGITSLTLQDTDTAGTNFPTGTIRIKTASKQVDIVVETGDTLKDIAEKIKNAAGDWLDIAYYDDNPTTAGTNATLTIAAKSGEPIVIYDTTDDDGNLSTPSVAEALGLSTAIEGTQDVSGWTNGTGDYITISVNGYSHTIDLDQTRLGSITAQEVVDIINARFQGHDLHAELQELPLGQKRIVLYSERGYRIFVNENLTNTLGIQTVPPTPPANYIPHNQIIGTRTLSTAKKVDFFEVVEDLAVAMENEDQESINSILGEIDTFIDNLLHQRAKVGAKQQRFELTIERMKKDNVDLQDLLSKVADVDMADIIMKLKMSESVYQASLAVGARVIMPTLVDFLK